MPKPNLGHLSKIAINFDVCAEDASLSPAQRSCLAKEFLPERGADTLTVPDAPAWRLHVAHKDSSRDLALVPQSDALAPLVRGQVRIAVRCAGINLRDVLDTLGGQPGDAGPLGREGAGIVTEVAAGVEHVAVGDRVMGLFPGAFGPVAIADALTIVRMPKGWSFHEGASVPFGFVTAYCGVADVSKIAPERVQELLTTLVLLFDQGALSVPPITCWHITHARHAFRARGRVKHAGKFVLSLPRALDSERAGLIADGATCDVSNMRVLSNASTSRRAPRLLGAGSGKGSHARRSNRLTKLAPELDSIAA